MDDRVDYGLTKKELEVMELIVKGIPSKTIALLLGNTENTIKVHVRRILHKFKVPNRTAAVRFYLGNLPREEIDASNSKFDPDKAFTYTDNELKAIRNRMDNGVHTDIDRSRYVILLEMQKMLLSSGYEKVV